MNESVQVCWKCGIEKSGCVPRWSDLPGAIRVVPFCQECATDADEAALTPAEKLRRRTILAGRKFGAKIGKPDPADWIGPFTYGNVAAQLVEHLGEMGDPKKYTTTLQVVRWLQSTTAVATEIPSMHSRTDSLTDRGDRVR